MFMSLLHERTGGKDVHRVLSEASNFIANKSFVTSKVSESRPNTKLSNVC